MRQRLGIAQAIAGDPRLIIVDEPTAGLDPEERLRFYNILAELAADRIVLLSTHIVEDVAVLCPRFAVIRKGRLVAQTSPTEARQAIDGKVFEGRARPGGDGRRSSAAACASSSPCSSRARTACASTSRDGPAPAGFEPVPADLEDAYLLLMQDVARSAAGSSRMEAPADRRGRRRMSLARTGVIFGRGARPHLQAPPVLVPGRPAGLR